MYVYAIHSGRRVVSESSKRQSADTSTPAIKAATYDASGAQVEHYEYLSDYGTDGELRLDLSGLELGTYRVAATVPGREDVEAELVVTTLEDLPDELLTLTIE